MLPILLVGKDKLIVESFINDFLKRNSFSESYVLFFHPEGKMIKIDQIRQIDSFLSRADEKRKLIIIYDFHTARPETQNAFLKTLEEKSAKAQFILHTKTKEQIIPTIISRCKIIRLREEIYKEKIDLTFQNSLGKLFSIYQPMTVEKAVDFCEKFLFFLKEELMKRKNINLAFLLKETIRLKSLIEKNNLNPQFAVDQLLIYFWQCYNENR